MCDTLTSTPLCLSQTSFLLRLLGSWRLANMVVCDYQKDTKVAYQVKV